MKRTRSNKIRPAGRCAAWGVPIAVAALIAVSAASALAGGTPFVPGNLLVERLGDGTQALTNAGNTIFFDQYTTGPAQTGPVTSITIPDGNTYLGSNPMIEEGSFSTSTSIGGMTLSPDGLTVSFGGYGTNRPYTENLNNSTSAAVPRAIGTLNGFGVYRQAATSYTAINTYTITSATTDDAGNFWGSAGDGVFYFGSNSVAATVDTYSARALSIVNGSLWYNSSTSSGPGYGIQAFTGLPSAHATPTLVVPLGANDSDYAFVVNPGLTVLYDADDGHYSATNAGISKWTYNGSAWVRQYNLLNNGTTGTACYGLAVNWNTPGGPTLYATTGDAVSANTIIAVQDTGSGNQTPVVLATAATKTIFRGLCFVPTNAYTPGALVVERLGDGTETLATAGNTIFFDEFLTNGTGQTPLFTVTIPDGNAYAGFPATGSPMIEEGTGATTGGMTLSPDGLVLTFGGYATNQPFSESLTTPTSALVPRAIGTLNGAGSYTKAVASTSAFSTFNIRSATTDDEGNFWGVAGGGDGLYYFGTASPAADITPSSDNLRGIRIYNNNLWFTTASSTPGYGIWEFTGLPTTAATPTRIITFISGRDSDYNFEVNPAGTVIYETDDGGSSAANAGIWKWTNNAGTWSRAYNLLGNGTTGTGCFGLTVNWTPAGGPVLYATTTTATTNSLITVQDTGLSNLTATIMATAPSNTFFRGVAFAPTNASSPTPPSIVSVNPASQTAGAGATVNISVEATGTMPLSFAWYQGPVNPGDFITGATNSTLTLTNVLGGASGSYSVVVSNISGTTVTSSVATVSVIEPAFVLQPSGAEGLVGGQVSFAAIAAGTALTNQWWYSDSTGDLLAPVTNGTLSFGTIVSGASNATPFTGDASALLSFANLQAGDFPVLPTNFVVVFGGTYGSVASFAVTLYSVGSTGTGSGQGDGAQIDGSGTGYGAILALWNFNGPNFNNATPPPWFGVGSASLVTITPFTTTVEDPFDGALSHFPYGIDVPPLTNNSWGTSSYPATNANPLLASNKLCGIQFMVSTLGAQDIVISYDARVSATASDYERLQYTTTGSNGPWIDYPTSTTFGGHSGSGNGGFLPFSYNLTGFSNVANNPNFGIRVVSEFQNTATYGAGVAGVPITNYVGTANTYGTGGTMTFDIVAFYGNAINTSTYSPPTITGTTNQTNNDAVLITNYFTVTGMYPPFTLAAQSLNPATVNPAFAITELTPGYFELVMTPNGIPDAIDGAPILVTATDANTNTVVTWFDLLLTTENPGPTNTLVSVGSTNLLPNASLTIPFTVGSSSQPLAGLTYAVSSDNNTLIPAANIIVNGTGIMNPTVTITPATGQAGSAQVSVTVYDNNPLYPPLGKGTTATFTVFVRPNTNVVFADYFDYDAAQQSLDQIVGGVWTHLTGIAKQMQVYGNGNGDYAVVDSVNNTENLQAALIGTPYSDTSATSLYSSFTVNLPGSAMPVGSYAGFFLVFNDDTGVTGNYECGVYALTNGVVQNDGQHYRLAIENFPGNGNENNAQIKIFPQDLVAGSNYVVVTKLVLSNGFSSLWVDPAFGQSSPSVTDTTTTESAGATLFPIGAVELRESASEDNNQNPGIVDLGYLKVGTTFDAVFPSLQFQLVPPNVIVNWSDPTLGIQSATNVAGPWTDVPLTPGLQPPFTNNTTTNAVFFKFGQ